MKRNLKNPLLQAYLGVHIRITHKQSINAYLQKIDDVRASRNSNCLTLFCFDPYNGRNEMPWTK